jgi:very-short-patch-repair endonuclease
MTSINKSPKNMSLMMSCAAGMRKRPTGSELRVKSLLESMGIRFMFQKGFCNHHTHFIVDFYFPRPRRLCLEIDGPIHDTKSQHDYDLVRDTFLRNERGVRVIRLLNCEADRITSKELETLIG